MAACKTIHGWESDIRRLLDRVLIGNGCWEWAGAVDRKTGYGKLSYEGRVTTAHRASYTALVGPIPQGLVVDHLCRNKVCVRPSHLEAVTNAENIRRGHHIGQRERWADGCAQGHPWTPENTKVRPGGKRLCRICARDGKRRRRLAGKE